MSKNTYQSIRQLIDARAEQCPDEIFLYVAESDKELTFQELQKNCQKVERYLDKQNINAAQTVGFLMDNGYWTVCLFLGVMYSGRVVLPMNAVAGPEQLMYTVEHSELKLIFYSLDYQRQYPQLLSETHQIEKGFTALQADEDIGAEQINALSDEYKINEIDIESIALMIYTSGTTGRPKGVLLSQGNVIAGGENTVQAHHLSNEDVGLCVLPLYHINAEIVSVIAPLLSAGSVVMAKKLSISQFWVWISKFSCTWFSAVPTIFSYLLEARQRELQKKITTIVNFEKIQKHVRFGRSASAALSPAVHTEFEALFGINIVETMGISECTAQILSNPVNKEVDYYGSPGLPVGNEMRIVNAAHESLKDDEIGELAVRGKNIMAGYFKNSDATAEALDDQGWFYTGDLGFRNKDGYFFVTGRSKELIIRGGENIAPREIDDVLYKRSEVLEAAAFGVVNDYYGQEVFACVSLKPGLDCSEEELLLHCQNLLGQIKSPKRILIIDELPKGPSGKIQRLKLAEREFE